MDQRIFLALACVGFFYFNPHHLMADEVIVAPTVDVYPDETEFDLRDSNWPGKYKIDPEKKHSLQNPYQNLSKSSSFQTYTGESGLTPFIQSRGSQSTSRTLVIVDDVPLNNAAGTGANPLLIPTEMMDEVQVTEGGQSPVYGESAIGGTLRYPMNFKKRNSFLVGGSGKNDWHQSNEHIVLAPDLGNKNDLNISQFWASDNGKYDYKLNSSGETGQREDNNTHLSRTYVKGQHHLGKVILKENLLYAQAFGDTPGSVDGTSGTKKYYGGFGSFGLTFPFTSKGLVTNRTNYVYSEYSTKLDTAEEETTFKNGQFKNTTLIKIEWMDLISNDFIFDYTHDNVESGESYYRDRADAGATVDFEVTDKFHLKRAFRYLSREGESVDSITFVHTDFVKKWFSVATGFKSPSLTELYSESAFFQSNEDLKPEKSRQVELGFGDEYKDPMKSYGFSWDWSLVGFHIYYEDLIVSEINDEGKFEPKNNEYAESFGATAQIGGQYRLTGLDFSFTQQEAEDLKTKNDLPLTPNTSWVAEVYQYWGPLKLSIREKYWSSYVMLFTNSQKRMGGWTTTDVSLSTHSLSYVQAQLGVDNLFNNSREYALGYPEPQQKIYLNTRWFF